MSNQAIDLASKRVELLREVVPSLRTLGLLINVANVAALAEMREAEAAAGSLGLDVARLEIRRTEDIAPDLEAFKGPARAVYVVADPLTKCQRAPNI